MRRGIPFLAARTTGLFGPAAGDFVAGARAWRVWSRFAWHDTVARYRRSWLGPFWIVLSSALFIAGLSLVYGTLFGMALADYVPFVAIGVLCWSSISTTVIEGASAFVESEVYIRQVRASLFIYVFRVMWRNGLVFLHQFVVVLAVLLLFGKIDVATLPLAACGLLLFFLQAAWVVPLLAIAGTRFRDLLPILTSALQILFFVTPVIWLPTLLGQRRWIADYNPLHSLIEVVREPLLGRAPALSHYGVVLAGTAVGCMSAAVAYGRFRERIVYWL
jgi:lipopolysaccharide transport system permease protein